MQGRKPEEKIQQPTFSHGYAENSHSKRKSRGGVAIGLRAGLSERQFRTPCEAIRSSQRNFAHHAKFHMVCEIFLCTDSVRFLSPDILCNLLFSPCNQPMIGFHG